MPPLDDFAINTLTEIINAGVSSKLVYEGSVCEAYPCWNDGACIQSNSTAQGYFCMCLTNYSGDHCQFKVENNCTSLLCSTGSVCFPELSTCMPLTNLSHYPSCSTNPCHNGGHCITVKDNFQRCLCSSLYHGVLCEIPSSADLISHLASTSTNWSFLQTLLLISMIVLLTAGCLAFCYGGNLSCYLLLPSSTRKRYSKWRDIPEEDLSWDPEEDDDDIINVGIFGSNNSRNNSHSNSSSSNEITASGEENGRRFEIIELKPTRQMRISTTSETFVSYNPATGPSQEDDIQHQSLLPSIT
uniref:EGF-like domain-containing protein n=1 Tax=Panagrolaimus sp. PS1159 TaxID=55785 RepID=A0AC35G7R8_9BILA